MISQCDNRLIGENYIEISRSLIANRIILDFVKIGNQSMNKIITISHISVGFSRNPQTISEFLTMFEKSGFPDFNKRSLNQRNKPVIPKSKTATPNKIKPQKITTEFIEKAAEFATFGSDITSKELRPLSRFEA